MASRIKQYFWIAAAAAAFYFLLSHHIIFSSIKEIDVLKKNELSMKYTFYSLKQADVGEVMRIDVLVDAGIEDVILKRGIISKERLEHIKNQIR